MMTPQDVEQFKRDGYFIDRGAFSPDDLARLKPIAEGLKQKSIENQVPGMRYWYHNRAKGQEIPEADRGRATWGVNEITRRALFEPELVNVFALPRVDHACNALLDQPRAWGIKMLWTPKIIGYNLGWHRDQMREELYDYAQYKPAEQDHIQFNAALNEDHCFLVVPGSHRRSLTQEEWHALHNDKTAELPGEVVADLAPGDILFMDAHALHRGRCGTETDRLTLHYSCQAQWVPLYPWGTDEDFGFITSDEFLEQIHPKARPYYERLRTAQRTTESMSFLKAAAAAHGWTPSEESEHRPAM